MTGISGNQANFFACCLPISCQSRQNEELTDRRQNLENSSPQLPLFYQNYMGCDLDRYMKLTSVNLRTPMSSEAKIRYIESVIHPKKITRLINSLENFNGSVISNISQMYGPLFREGLRYDGTSRGMCRSIIAHWIIYDSLKLDFFSCVYNKDNKKINISLMNSVKEFEVISAPKDFEGQEGVLSTWFLEYGLSKVSSLTQIKNQSISHHNCGHMLCFLSNVIEQAPYHTVPRWEEIKQSPYHIVNMWGNKPPGHCFLVKYESNQVIFVDANFGSFSFADWDSFGSWFAEKFWATSKYGYSYHSFSIMTYEKVNI